MANNIATHLQALGNMGNVLTARLEKILSATTDHDDEVAKLASEAEHAFITALKHRSNMADVHYNLLVIQIRETLIS